MRRWIVHAQSTFSAVHALPSYGGRAEKPHPHEWRVAVRVATESLNSEGYAVDFHALRAALDAVVAPLDGTDLNDHPLIGDLPSAERVTDLIAGIMAQACRELSGKLVRVTVWEGPENRVDLELS